MFSNKSLIVISCGMLTLQILALLLTSYEMVAKMPVGILATISNHSLWITIAKFT